MELRHLRYFVTVAEELSFRVAAERLFITQPSLSHQIRALEQDMAVRLFDRTTRRVELTPAGAIFFDRVKLILEEVDRATHAAQRAADGQIGGLSVGFTGSSTYELLPSVARAFREQYPDVDLTLRGEMLTPDQTAALLSGRLDVGFLRPPVGSPELTVELLRSERLIAVLPEGHRLASQASVRLENMSNESFVMYPSHWGSVVTTVFEDACARAGFEPRVAHEVRETSTLLCFVAAGLGIAVVPESVRYMQVTGVKFTPLSGTQAEVSLAIAWRTNDRSIVLKRFIELVRSQVSRPNVKN